MFFYPSPDKTNSSSSGGSNNSTVPLSELFKKPAGSWDCDACLVRNNAGTMKCMACETPRPQLLASGKN